MTDVDLRLLDLVQDHPTLDATPDGRVLVMSEIGAEGAAQQGEDLGQAAAALRKKPLGRHRLR